MSFAYEPSYQLPNDLKLRNLGNLGRNITEAILWQKQLKSTQITKFFDPVQFLPDFFTMFQMSRNIDEK